MGHKSVRCPDQACGVCGSKGHSVEICVNVVTVLACENTKSSNDENDAAISGEHNNESNDEGGCSALAWQVGDLTVIRDSGASCQMSYSSTRMSNCRESNAYMRTANRPRYLIEGDLPLTIRSSSGDVPLLLRNVANVPSLNYHLLSLRADADKGHTYTGNHEGVTVFSLLEIPYFSHLLEESTYCTHITPACSLARPPMQLLRLGLRPATVTPSLTSMSFTLLMPMPTRERYARRPSKWA